MTPFLLFSLAGFLVSFVLGIYVLSLNARNSGNRIFALFALSISIWNFGEMMMKIVSSAESAVIWDKVASALGWCFLGPLFLNFILNFTKKDQVLKNRLIFFLLYAPSFVWAYLKLFTGWIHSGVVHVYWGWDVIIEPGFALYSIHLLLLFSIGFWTLLQSWKSSESKVMRQQAIVVLWGVLIPFTIGSFSDALLPIFGFHFVRLAGVASMIFVAFFAYALGRYQLMQVNPTRAATKIIETLPDPLLLVDAQMKIISANPVALKLFSYTADELAGRPATMLISDKNNTFAGEQIDSLLPYGDINTFDATIINRNLEKIPVILSYSLIRDITSEPIGMVVVAKDIREKKDLIEKLEQSQKSIRENSAPLNAILANMTESLIIENRDHEIIYANDAARSLLGPILGKKCFETALGGTAEAPVCTVSAVISQGGKKFNTIVADQKSRYIEILGSRFINPDGALQAMEIMRDITDQKITDDILKTKLAELEEINDLSVGRELRMIELENEIDALLKEAGRPPKYHGA